MSRLSLHIKAILFRIAQTIGRYCDLYLSYPRPQRAAFTRRIPSTVGKVPGSFNLLFYTPPSYTQLAPSSSEKFPVLINFHGGGYTIGHASDDARWATEVVKRTGGIVVSVDYRLAPSYPFPTGIEDCVSAIMYLWKHADELHLDISRTALSGFSAGANFTYTAAFRLHEELKTLRAEGAIDEEEEGRLVSIVTFYPPVDWTKTRAERRASNPNATPIIPPVFGNLFDEAYLYPRPDMKTPLVSPGLAPDQLLREALPDSW